MSIDAGRARRIAGEPGIGKIPAAGNLVLNAMGRRRSCGGLLGTQGLPVNWKNLFYIAGKSIIIERITGQTVGFRDERAEMQRIRHPMQKLAQKAAYKRA